MKKLFRNLMLVAVAALGMASCEDVPAPFVEPGGDEPEVPVVTEITCAEAVALCNELGDGATSSETYVITGYIVDVFANISNGQQSFWISDAKGGAKMVQAYWANLPTGVDAFKVGSQVKITGKLLKYVNASNVVVPEVKNADVEILSESGDEPVTPGTVVTCAEAATLCNALADGASSEETYTITGYITDVFATVSKGQQSFWMADTKDGGKVIQAYWANLPEGVDAFKVGSQVKITGKLLKYVNPTSGVVVPEVKNATVEIISEGEGGGDEPVPGTAVSCAKAVELCNALADGATSEEAYTISGYITEIISAVSRNQQSFWMADTKDGGQVFQAYWANLPEGVDEFKAGSQVKITGKITKYVKDGNVVPEIKNANVEIISEGEGGNDGGDEGGDEPGTKGGITVSGSTILLTAEGVAAGDESTFVDLNTFGYGNATAVTTVNAEGCTITFGSGENKTNAPMFYTATKGVRMYANNTVSFTADKTIATITLECDVYNGVTYVGNDTRTLAVNDNVFLLTNAHTETKGGVQMRIKTVKFTFAK